ncbi:DUF2293 domain-containing protein [Jiella endophytica]|uniref:DUF2293 domain-containing protein n=1 Tax=Jiella endophytica TaxID=2558362 RepID=A0A4Y8R9H1_9HYPH|nr:DUF2293 domain-containing protein [Jiella endophytica]TFF17709.1 DUF2293 domain-containing protein [Jiella endophytica]
MATERQRRIARAVTAAIPRAPFLDAEAIREAARSRHMRSLAPEAAVWLAAIARIRHEYTDYDVLMDDGYDRDAARFFVIDEINAVLDRWGARRRLDPDVPEAELAHGPVSGTDDEDDGDIEGSAGFGE